jgi:predicted HTH domain antitoxin
MGIEEFAMPLTITDDQLRTMGLTEREAAVEFACRMFDAGRLTFHAAMRLAALDRIEFEEALRSRGVAIYRPSADELRDEVEALKRAGV